MFPFEFSVGAKARAYCPYSNFRVGAALLLPSPTTTATTTTSDHHPRTPVPGGGSSSEGFEIAAGANVENASYPVGTCAERVALATAVVQGHRRFRALAVATDVASPASPCGMCRQ